MYAKIPPSLAFCPIGRRPHTLEAADRILENRFVTFDGLPEIDFTRGMNWGFRPEKNGQTATLYLHALTVIPHLIHAYTATKRVDYIHKATDIALSWIDYDELTGHAARALWTDHAVADRTVHLVNLLSVEGFDSHSQDRIVSAISRGAAFLFDDENYQPDNHGLMMDRALAYSAIALPGHSDRQLWLMKAWARANEAIIRDFSAKGVHLENSPEYHGFVKKLATRISSFFDQIGKPLSGEAKRRLGLSESYFPILLMPNKELPSIGDSGTHSFPDLEKDYSSFVDEQAAIAVMQAKDKCDERRSTWVSFVAGCARAAHKHCDDLSINYFARGYSILVDTGKYNYDREDPRRVFARSASAHNTIVVDGCEYQVKPNLGSARITGFMPGNMAEVVRGESTAYKGVKIIRTVILLKPADLIIWDRVASDTFQRYRQVFNLHPDVVTSHVGADIELSCGTEVFLLRQLTGVSGCIARPGDEGAGFISPKYNVSVPSTRVEFPDSGKEVEYVTHFSPRSRNPLDVSVERRDGVLYVIANGETRVIE